MMNYSRLATSTWYQSRRDPPWHLTGRLIIIVTVSMSTSVNVRRWWRRWWRWRWWSKRVLRRFRRSIDRCFTNFTLSSFARVRRWRKQTHALRRRKRKRTTSRRRYAIQLQLNHRRNPNPSSSSSRHRIRTTRARLVRVGRHGDGSCYVDACRWRGRWVHRGVWRLTLTEHLRVCVCVWS